jgi:hypothetical protein
MQKSYDEDTFVFTAPPGKQATLFVIRAQGDASDGPNISLKSFDADREQIATSHSNSRGGTVTHWANVMPGTQFYLHARSPWKGSYTLTVETRQIGDTDEPNEERAVRLKLDSPHNAYLVGRLNSLVPETDLYQIKVRRKGRLSVVVSNVAKEIYPRIDVMNVDGEKIVSLYSKNKGATLRKEFRVKKRGVYLLRLKTHGVAARRGMPGAGGDEAEYTTKAYQISVKWKK